MKYYDQQPGLYSLAKGWKFKEMTEYTEDGGIIGHSESYGYAKGNGARGPVGVSWDDSQWERVQLPHDWVPEHDFNEKAATGENQGYKDRGRAVYRLHFGLDPEDRGKQILIDFEGMSKDANVYINGSLVYNSISGYHPFMIDITDMAIYDIRGNVLAVEIDTASWEGWWYEGAGIYRQAWLIKKNKLHVEQDGIYVKPQYMDGQWITNVEVEVGNSLGGDEEALVRVRLEDPEGHVIAEDDCDIWVQGYDQTTATWLFQTPDVQLWDLENPVRYRCIAEVVKNGEVVDYLKTYYGYRTIRFDAETGFYLNDVNMKLKGFCNHQDHTGIGVAVPYAIKEYRIKLLKEIGANAYRCAHNTDPEIQEICDRYGMMVMEENRSFRTSESVLANVRDMVRKARNHPSVIMYSLWNEEPLQGTETGARLAERLRAEVFKLDDTRPTTGAMNGGYMEDEGASKIIDVTGINYHTSAYDEFHAKYPDRPLIGSETVSAFMVRGEHETDASRNTISNYDDDCAGWGNTVRDGWRAVAERPFVAGTFVWTGFDYRGEPTPYVWPSVSTFFGTYDSCGFRKDCCWLYEAFWTEKPLIHVLPDWDRPMDNGTPIRVMCFTNCEEAEIFINGRSQGRKACDKYDQVSWDVEYEMGTLEAVGYRNGEKVAEDVQKTPGIMTGIRMSLSKDTMAYDGQDAIAVNVEAVDPFGNFVPSADTLIFFEVEGGAEIIGVGNGDPNSHEPDAASYRHMFHGRCQAIIRNCDGADVIVKAYAEEKEGDEMRITTYEVPEIPNITIIEEDAIGGWTLYKDLFEEFPDPNPVVSDQDMNSFEPVAFTGHPQAIFDGKSFVYGLYRTEYDFGPAAAGRLLSCSEVWGDAWIYVDGKLLDDVQHHAIAIELPPELEGRHVVTLVMYQNNPGWTFGGILDPIVVKK